MTKLTPKQQRFVEEYLIDLNAAASARRAGYSVRSADAAAKTGIFVPQGCLLMQKLLGK